MFKRRPLPKGIRHEVFIRDSYKCTECGAGKEKYSLEIDHIISISKGGTDEMSNLRTLCEPCNREKNDLVHENNNPKGIEILKGKPSKHFDDDIIRCPECNFEYTHPIEVRVWKADECIIINSEKQVHNLKIQNPSRGVKIGLWFRGECGHHWSYNLQFHKGITNIQISSPGGIIHPDEVIKTIWRD